MSMSGLLVLAEHGYDSEDILHKHIIPGGEIAHESSAFPVPSVIGVRITQRSVGGQRHEAVFRKVDDPDRPGRLGVPHDAEPPQLTVI